MTPIGSARVLQFPWNRKGAARVAVLDFLALARREAPSLATHADTAAALHTLAWLDRLVDMQKDHLPLPPQLRPGGQSSRDE